MLMHPFNILCFLYGVLTIERRNGRHILLSGFAGSVSVFSVELCTQLQQESLKERWKWGQSKPSTASWKGQRWGWWWVDWVTLSSPHTEHQCRNEAVMLLFFQRLHSNELWRPCVDLDFIKVISPHRCMVGILFIYLRPSQGELT